MVKGMSYPFRREFIGFPQSLPLRVATSGNSRNFLLHLFKVLGHRIIRQGHRSYRRLNEDRAKTVFHFVPCCRYLEARPGVLGGFRGVRDVAEEA